MEDVLTDLMKIWNAGGTVGVATVVRFGSAMPISAWPRRPGPGQTLAVVSRVATARARASRSACVEVPAESRMAGASDRARAACRCGSINSGP